MIKYSLSLNFNAGTAAKFDKAKGVIRDVSIITEGPALGHGVEIDAKTLSQLFALAQGRVVKAYWTHNEGEIGQEVGLFSGFHIDTATKQLKARFEVFDAFRKTYPERWAYLTELIEKAPKEFGVSIHFSGDAVWVLDTGAEVPADGDRPANAVGDEPRVRVVELFSADFVGSPAANAGGLFHKGKVTELLDPKQKLTGDLATLSANITAAGEQLKAKDTAIAELTLKFDAANKELEAVRATLATKETEFTAAKTAQDTTIAELSKQIAAFTADIKARETAEAEKEAAHAAQIQSLNKALISFGAVPVNIYQGEPIDHRATWLGITDSIDKVRYFQKHREAILRGD